MRLSFQFANADRPYTIAKNLDVALLDYYAFLTPDPFYEEFPFLYFNNDPTFYAVSVCETVYENTKAATVHVALICDMPGFLHG